MILILFVKTNVFSTLSCIISSLVRLVVVFFINSVIYSKMKS